MNRTNNRINQRTATGFTQPFPFPFPFRIPLPALLALALLLGACGKPADQSLQWSDAWVRVPPPGAQVAAGFVSLHNPSQASRQIVGVTSDVAGRAEIHDMRMDKGMMRMRHLSEGLSLAPGEDLRLAPGGKHLMLFELQRSLQTGETVRVILQLADGQQLAIDMPVREGAPG